MTQASEPTEPGQASGAGRHPRRHPQKKNGLKGKLSFLAIGLVVGIIAMAGFVTAIEWTNRTEFCLNCHSMKHNYDEYKASVHYKNRAGAHAQCADCHVPKALGPKLIRKAFAVNDIISEIQGTIDTDEKFQAKRGELADRVWTYMIKSDSRECRTCHTYDSMDLEKQNNTAKRKHPQAALEGRTCIECHKGVAHKMPRRED